MIALFLVFRLLPSCFTVLLLLLLVSINTAAAIAATKATPTPTQTSQGAPIVIIPAITGNILAVVSFLIGTSSFILGLRIQSASRTTKGLTSSSSTSSTLPYSLIYKYFELLILSLVIPSIIVNIWNTSSWKPFIYTRCSLFTTPFRSFNTSRSDIIFSHKVTCSV